MAIQTIKATIQMRKGAEQNFDPSQMTAGEWAVSTDSKKVWMCFSPGIVRRMATYEAFEQDMLDIQTIIATCRDIQAAVERFERLAEQHASQAETWSITSKSWAIGGTGTREGEDADNSKYYSEQSKSEADRAKNEADRAASIAGIDIDSELSETSVNPVQNKVIAKVLAKLKEIAFSGSYTDLSNKPSIPSITNNYLATQPGTAADAMLAKELRGDIDAINSKLGDLLIVKTVQKTISVLYLNQFYVDISAPDGYKAIGLANHAGDYRINIFSARISNNKIVFVALSTASEEVSVTLLFDVLFLKI